VLVHPRSGREVVQLLCENDLIFGNADIQRGIHIPSSQRNVPVASMTAGDANENPDIQPFPYYFTITILFVET
jgi:hypothetical protein